MLSPVDVAVIGVAALLLFGPDQLPKVARKVGAVMRDVQNTSQSFIREMERAADIDHPFKASAWEEPAVSDPPVEPRSAPEPFVPDPPVEPRSAPEPFAHEPSPNGASEVPPGGQAPAAPRAEGPGQGADFSI